MSRAVGKREADFALRYQLARAIHQQGFRFTADADRRHAHHCLNVRDHCIRNLVVEDVDVEADDLPAAQADASAPFVPGGELLRCRNVILPLREARPGALTVLTAWYLAAIGLVDLGLLGEGSVVWNDRKDSRITESGEALEAIRFLHICSAV